MDARFIIDELSRQVQAAVAPGQPQMVAGKRHQHGAHPKIDPAVLRQGAHTGIDKRQARFANAPRLQPCCISTLWPQAIIGTVQVAKFKTWLILQLLHEMTMPVLPT